MLVYMKLVEPDVVFNFWGDVVESVWDRNEELINGIRKDIGTPFSFQYWEYPAKEVKKRKIRSTRKNSVRPQLNLTGKCKKSSLVRCCEALDALGRTCTKLGQNKNETLCVAFLEILKSC